MMNRLKTVTGVIDGSAKRPKITFFLLLLLFLQPRFRINQIFDYAAKLPIIVVAAVVVTDVVVAVAAVFSCLY